MTLSGVMALILRYFTKFVHDVVVKQLLGLPPFQNLLLIVYDHINTICAIIQRLFGENRRRQYPPLQVVLAYAHASCASDSVCLLTLRALQMFVLLLLL